MSFTAPVWAAERIRVNSDGEGITTLIAFYGCPLSCRYCINPACRNTETECEAVSPEALLDIVSIDRLYFSGTNGGVVFGGGEPLLHSGFIEEFCRIKPDDMEVRIQTSLNADASSITRLSRYIGRWFVDIKDMNPDIYLKYTGRSNEKVIKNLEVLKNCVDTDKITIRLPLIPEFNTESDREQSRIELKKMGFIDFDLFRYITEESL